MAFIMKNYLKMSVGKQVLNVYLQKGLSQQGLKTSSILTAQHKIQNTTASQSNEAATNIAKKSKESPKITLIQNQNVTVTALEEAKNLAKRRSMHLVKVQEMDAKTHRPVYKLLTSAEMLQNELSELKTSNESNNSATAGLDKASSQKKTEKTLNIGSRITDHDLSSRLKNITKWLTKRNEVRIMIQGSSDRDMVNGEKIFKTIEEAIKTPDVMGKIVQKRIKGSIIKFNIIPVVSSGPEKPPSNTQ